ncbi:hypothetical protein [Parvularcula bermudensis]|nr:hypothetical protein [Parvularcula bermudensis]
MMPTLSAVAAGTLLLIGTTLGLGALDCSLLLLPLAGIAWRRRR